MAKKKAEPELHEWLCRGWIKLSGVQFSVSAATEDEARKKAAAGDWDDYDTTVASGEDWKLDEGSIELNE
jgi:hypothetical protein